MTTDSSVRWIEIVIAAVIYTLGFLGNFFAFIVFTTSTQFRKISTCLFFLLMTMSNCIYLWTLTTELLHMCGVPIDTSDFLQCHFYPFVENVSRAMSTYFSVLITIDRLIRSESALHSKRICTRKNVCFITFIIFIVFSSFWSFYLFSFSYRDSTENDCIYNQTIGYSLFLININIPVRAVLFYVLPVIIMSVANIRMIKNIRQAHHRIGDVQQMHEGNRISQVVSSTRVSRVGFLRDTASDRMIFCLMIASVLTFIVTQLPFHAYTITQFYVGPVDTSAHLLIYNILLIWSSIYFGIGFYLYCWASVLFRRKFINIIKKISHHCQTCLC